MRFISVIVLFCFISILSVFAESGRYVTNGTNVGCTTKSNLDKVGNYVAANDYVAFQKMIGGKRCIQLKKGIEVQLMNTSWGKVEIRPIGHEATIWTYMEAIQKK